MRRAVRRLTWILLSLALSTVLSFALLAELVRSPVAPSSLPRFFNGEPRNVRDLTQAALERLSRESDPRAAAELARLGGAALPYVLPNFEQLDAAARERVALALVPVALRMGAAQPEELSTGASAVSFWSRFWQDRSVDFRVTVVRRLIARLAERSLALRREDVLALDTFALPELVRALGAVKTEEDVRRVRRLTQVLSHVAGVDRTVPRDATVAQATAVVRSWRLWWEEHGADFTALDGPNRVSAMVKDTAYGRWLASVLRGELGRTTDGRTGLELLRASAASTVVALLLVTLLGSIGGSLLATWAARRGGAFAERLCHLGLALAALLLLGVASGAASSVALGVLLLATAHSSLILAQSQQTSGPMPSRFSAALAHALSFVAVQAPLLASLVLVLESVQPSVGLGFELKQAVGRADLHALMAITLCCAAAAALIIVMCDAVHAVLWRQPKAASQP